MNQGVNLRNIIVNSLDNTSGIFIGRNHANQWHSTIKSNQGFGQTSSVNLHRVLNVVIDNDRVDMVTNEANKVISPVEEAPANKKATDQFKDIDIKFNGIKVNAQNNNSAVSIGNNQQDIWHNTSKNNFGIGRSNGMNKLSHAVNLISDEDVWDTLIHENASYSK